MYYDVHLLPSGTDDPRAALAGQAARGLSDHEPDPPAVDAAVLARVRDRWVRPREGLRIVDEGGSLTVRLPYWYVGRQARTQAKVLHQVVKELEQATGRRGFDPQLDDWFRGRSPGDTAAVLDAVADFQARERVDSPAVDARNAARAAAARGPRLPRLRRRT